MTRSDSYHGVLPLNKPVGISSHDAVIKVRRSIRQAGIGHTGTLDPRAQGLLVLCLGRTTKAARFIAQCDKTYEAEIRLGLTSTTYDAEGIDPDARTNDVPKMTESDFTSLLREFEGRSQQKVPVFSAVRVRGRHLYELARMGKQVEAPVQEVNISRISLLSYAEPFLRIRVECGKGTYIRSLAHAIGERLKCGGYLSALTRTSVGNLHLKEALSLARVATYHELGELTARLLPLERVLGYGAITVSDQFSRSVINGATLRHGDVVGTEGTFTAGDRVFLRDQRGSVLAIGTAGVNSDSFGRNVDSELFRYTRVLN